MERRGSHSTFRGMELRAKHDASYKKMLIGKSNSRGKIKNAEWVGNSVYGIVKVYFEDGTDNLYSNRANGFRPRKEDFNLIENEVAVFHEWHMKKTCNGCRALLFGGNSLITDVRHAHCSLGYQVNSLNILNPKPLEGCPKPKTIADLMTEEKFSRSKNK